MCGIEFIKKISTRLNPSFHTSPSPPILPLNSTMADLPVYDGAIGIDLGTVLFNSRLPRILY